MAVQELLASFVELAVGPVVAAGPVGALPGAARCPWAAAVGWVTTAAGKPIPIPFQEYPGTAVAAITVAPGHV